MNQMVKKNSKDNQEEINEQLVGLVKKLKTNRDKVEQLQNDNDFIKNRIMFLLDKLGEKSFTLKDIEFSPKSLVCMICEKNDVSYDLKRAKEILGAKCKGFTHKEYDVSDFEKLKALAKAHGINPEEFKSCFDIKEKVDNKKLEQMYAVGDVDVEDVQEFMEVKTTRYVALR